VGYDTVVGRNHALMILLNFYSQKNVVLFSEFISVTFISTFILLGILCTCKLPLRYTHHEQQSCKESNKVDSDLVLNEIGEC
jgi:hypothetical protein